LQKSKHETWSSLSDYDYELEDQTNLGTTWSGVLLERLTGPQPVKKLPTF